jgi:hypothetical protein
MISVFRGKSYTFRDGIDTQSKNWLVSTKVKIPTRIDKTWGWKDPLGEKPTFYFTDAFMCLECVNIQSVWRPVNNNVFFVPMFSVEEIVETSSTLKYMPSIIEAPELFYLDKWLLNNQQISYELSNWLIEDISERPLKVDSQLDWTNLETIEPSLVTTSVGIGRKAELINDEWTIQNNDLFNIPLFLTSKILTFKQETSILDISRYALKWNGEWQIQ